MATGDQEYPTFRQSSPSPPVSPTTSPTPAIGACPELSRSVSEASDFSELSVMSSNPNRASSGNWANRLSTASFTNRQSMMSTTSTGQPIRRGYVRPQGTNFAASAQSRDSVMSLGSIMHLQYYFARTGLLDGKGGQMAKKKAKDGSRETIDFTLLDTSFLTPGASDKDSSYSSMGDSPELMAEGMTESPVDDGEYYSDDDPDHPHMLPPTVSTYVHREKPIPKPPNLEELKDGLEKTIGDAKAALEEAKAATANKSPIGNHRREGSQAPASPITLQPPTSAQAMNTPDGWYELQGMHILDIMTLAIRAAKLYYTAHDNPTRLSSIKSERQIRAELLSVMEVLKRMATRTFTGGMKNEERGTMENWVASVEEMLAKERELDEEERALRATYTWLHDNWRGTEIEREYAFLKSMDPEAASLPDYVPSSEASQLPTEFLAAMQNGLRLVKLHNAVVRQSKRRFGHIHTFHTDTLKPYRCADNLRYWVKAAELRWECVLKVDVMGVVSGTDDDAWKGLETAIWKWCKTVREEISAEWKAE